MTDPTVEGAGVPDGRRVWAARPVHARPGHLGFVAGLALRGLCGALTWAVLGLVVWVAVPLLLGWQASVITSGSMSPAIRTGDVIVSRPYDGGPLDAGSVVTFRDARGRGLVTHRIVDRQGPRTYRTKGDANPTPDSTPLPARHVVGVGRYRIPAIGLPTLWMRQGDHVALLSSLLAAALVVAGSCRPLPATATAPARPMTRAIRQSGRAGHRAAVVGHAHSVGRLAVGEPDTGWPGPVWTARPAHRPRWHGLHRHPIWSAFAVVVMVLPAMVFAAGALAGTTAVAASWSSDALQVPQDVLVSRDCLDSEKQTTVTWSAVSAAGGADGYDVHRSEEPGGPYSLVAELDGLDTTTYSHSGSALDTSSYYVVRSASRLTSWRSTTSEEVRSPSCA